MCILVFSHSCQGIFFSSFGAETRTTNYWVSLGSRFISFIDWAEEISATQFWWEANKLNWKIHASTTTYRHTRTDRQTQCNWQTDTVQQTDRQADIEEYTRGSQVDIIHTTSVKYSERLIAEVPSRTTLRIFQVVRSHMKTLYQFSTWND